MGTFAAMSDPGHAEPVVSATAEVVSVPPTGTTWPADIVNASPRISDDGKVVVFDSMTGTDAATRRVMISTRPAPGVTTAVPDAPSAHPGVSGNGCVVAYSVPVVATNSVRLVALKLDRPGCAPAGPQATPVTIETIDNPGTEDGALPPPALSFDGTKIVWSTGTTVLRYVDSGTGFALPPDTIRPPLSRNFW